MGKSPPSTQTVTQKTEIDPIQKSFLFGTPLPEDYKAAMVARNRDIMGLPPLEAKVEQESPLDMINRGYYGGDNPGDPGRGVGGGGGGGATSFASSGLRSHMPGGINTANPNSGFNQSVGGLFGGNLAGEQGPPTGDVNPRSRPFASGGIVGLAGGGMVPARMPDLSNRETAYLMGLQALQGAAQPRMGYAVGGYVEGPGTGRSDDIPATIYQNGVPVQDAALSDGEFVMTERAVRGAGAGDREAGAARMYEMMRRFENGGRVS